jgi:uncharacterized protein YjbJ (UPF0337 family)
MNGIELKREEKTMSQYFNENVIAGKWKEIKGDLQKMWGRLTDDELEEAKGNMNNFAGTVQRKYGMAQDEVRRQIDEVFNKYKSDETDATTH